MKAKCWKCKTKFDMGWNGVVDDHNRPTCDNCARVQRDVNGYAWTNDELTHTYEDVSTGERSTVTREEAFRK